MVPPPSDAPDGAAERTRTRWWIPQTAPALVVFWLVLSGHFDALLLTLGAVSVAVVCWLTVRAEVLDGEDLSARRLLRLPGYLTWLAAEALRSAAAVTRLVWAPRLALRPVVEPVPMPPMSPVGEVTYANSITFTPGTLALDVEEDYIRVHSLETASIETLRAGRMLRRVRRLEGTR